MLGLLGHPGNASPCQPPVTFSITVATALVLLDYWAFLKAVVQSRAQLVDSDDLRRGLGTAQLGQERRHVWLGIVIPTPSATGTTVGTPRGTDVTGTTAAASATNIARTGTHFLVLFEAVKLGDTAIPFGAMLDFSSSMCRLLAHPGNAPSCHTNLDVQAWPVTCLLS